MGTWVLGWEARREPWLAARAHAPIPRPRSDGPPSPRMEPSKKLDAASAMPANPPLKLHPERGAGPAVLVPEQGGYKERFVKAVEDKYKCEKCRLVLCSPKQTECGHRFCETCMGALLRWVPQARAPLPSAPHEASPLGPPGPCLRGPVLLEALMFWGRTTPSTNGGGALWGEPPG